MSKIDKALDIHDIEEPEGGGSFDVERESYIEVPLLGYIDTTHLRHRFYEDAHFSIYTSAGGLGVFGEKQFSKME
ncbi:MAG: hypothetical protein U5K28_05580 [Halobacteriales archaeon]|nr:hypothetical protein [Halobacteriales archaeon]